MQKLKEVYDLTRVWYEEDRLFRFTDGTYRYKTSYGDSWDFSGAYEFICWAEANGMVIEDEIRDQFCD